MPFTPAHIAAVLPLRRRWMFVWSALVAGSIAPDLEYFLSLGPHSRAMHRFPGTFLYTLPVALTVLWVWHTFISEPLLETMPESLRECFHPEKFRFGGPSRFAAIVFSVVVGIYLHVFWDDFTHMNSPITARVTWLNHIVRVPGLGTRAIYTWLQLASSAAGLLILAIAFWKWFRAARAEGGVVRVYRPWQKWMLYVLMTVAASFFALHRTYVSMGHRLPVNRYTTLITGVSGCVFFCWEALAFCVLAGGWKQRGECRDAPHGRRSERPYNRSSL